MKNYKITGTRLNSHGAISHVKKGNGHVVTRKEVISDIKDGATVRSSCEKANKPKPEVHLINNGKAIRSNPDGKKCNNLSELPKF